MGNAKDRSARDATCVTLGCKAFPQLRRSVREVVRGSAAAGHLQHTRGQLPPRPVLCGLCVCVYVGVAQNRRARVSFFVSICQGAMLGTIF